MGVAAAMCRGGFPLSPISAQPQPAWPTKITSRPRTVRITPRRLRHHRRRGGGQQHPLHPGSVHRPVCARADCPVLAGQAARDRDAGRISPRRARSGGAGGKDASPGPRLCAHARGRRGHSVLRRCHPHLGGGARGARLVLSCAAGCCGRCITGFDRPRDTEKSRHAPRHGQRVPQRASRLEPAAGGRTSGASVLPVRCPSANRNFRKSSVSGPVRAGAAPLRARAVPGRGGSGASTWRNSALRVKRRPARRPGEAGPRPSPGATNLRARRGRA